MTKVINTEYEYDTLTGKLIKSTTTEVMKYDDDLCEEDCDLYDEDELPCDEDDECYEEDDDDLYDEECEDEDDDVLYDGEFTIDLHDLAFKALGLFTLGVSAITAVKLFRKVSK